MSLYSGRGLNISGVLHVIGIILLMFKYCSCKHPNTIKATGYSALGSATRWVVFKRMIVFVLLFVAGGWGRWIIQFWVYHLSNLFLFFSNSNTCSDTLRVRSPILRAHSFRGETLTNRYVQTPLILNLTVLQPV